MPSQASSGGSGCRGYGEVVSGTEDVGHDSLAKLVNVALPRCCGPLPPLAQDDHTVAHLVDIFQAVADDDDGGALGLELSHQSQYLVDGRHAQGGGGVVHDDDLGIA